MKVFLCHASIDKPAVRRIKTGLAAHGCDLWLDECELFPGDSLFGKIQDAITDSSCVLAFISENSAKSAWVKDELNAFLSIEKTSSRTLVIPIIVDSTLPPPFLAHRLQVRTLDKSLGSIVQEVLRGVLRSHAVLLLRPAREFIRLEPFNAELERLKIEAANGAMHTVFDSFELAEIIVNAIDSSDDSTYDIKAAIPRCFDFLSAISPRVIQVILTMEQTIGAYNHAELLIGLIWRMVTLTFSQALRRHGDPTKLQSNEPYDLGAALREYDTIVSSKDYYEPGYGIRPAAWLKHHGTPLADCRDFQFVGGRSRDGSVVEHAFHVFIPSRYLRSRPTLFPAADFMPYQWIKGVMPLIVANAAVHYSFTQLDIAEVAARVGLRPEDYKHYGPP